MSDTPLCVVQLIQSFDIALTLDLPEMAVLTTAIDADNLLILVVSPSNLSKRFELMGQPFDLAAKGCPRVDLIAIPIYVGPCFGLALLFITSEASFFNSFRNTKTIPFDTASAYLYH